jgi:hypothetical protein
VHRANKKWFESYLIGRKQRAEITSLCHHPQVLSSWKELFGVPQGSNLGLLLFIMYINFLLNIKTGSRLVLFLQDMSATVTANNLQDVHTKFVCTITQINEWFSANGLTLNVDKTNVIHFKSNHHKNSILQITYQRNQVQE